MKLHLRIPTALGPRTIVTQNLCEADARAIAAGAESVGLECKVDEDTSALSIADHVQLRREAAVRAIGAFLLNLKPRPAPKGAIPFRSRRASA